MLRFLFDWIHDASDYLIQHGWNESLVDFLSGIFILAVLAASASVVYWVVRIILKKILKAAYRRHPKAWIEVLLKRQTLSFICYFLLCLFYSKGIAYMFSELPAWIPFVTKVLKLFSLYFFLRALTGVIWTIFDIRQATILNKTVAMKGLIQFITVIVYFIGGIVAVAILANKQPLAFIGGLSAASAVLMLVFKDSIVGLVAGVQISLNDMVRIGDWITMPSQGVDGNVTDISLTTVKVQNFDLTIISMPTAALISQSVQNWRGLQISGGRRIQRSIYVDFTSISFCDEAMLEKFGQIDLLHDSIEAGKTGKNAAGTAVRAGLTNVDVFMRYTEAYLRNHPRIHHEADFTLLVRQLPAGDEGLPIQVYCFTVTPEWLAYEAIASEVMSHLLAMLPFFGLRVYQRSAHPDTRSLEVGDLPFPGKAGAED